MTNEYLKYRIKIYKYWHLYLHKNQNPYIGRCYAWAIRDDANRVIDMTKEERNELFDIVIPEWEKSITDIFSHDWSNIASLGNTSPHLHWHMIPRYRNSKNFNGIEYTDPDPDRNYAFYNRIGTPETDLDAIKEIISQKINK